MKRLLVVEDDPLVARVVQSALRRRGNGLEVVVVPTCEAAESLLDAPAARFDGVILDLGLPGCAGVDALRRVRAAAPVPVMVASGSERLREEALGAGAAGFVSKAELEAEFLCDEVERIFG